MFFVVMCCFILNMQERKPRWTPGSWTPEFYSGSNKKELNPEMFSYCILSSVLSMTARFSIKCWMAQWKVEISGRGLSFVLDCIGELWVTWLGMLWLKRNREGEQVENGDQSREGESWGYRRLSKTWRDNNTVEGTIPSSGGYALLYTPW